MTPRERTEKLERESLSPYACCSADSRGRKRPEAACEIRTAFQRDRDRIIHSKAFRRLMHKTQVFMAPESDHYRTRLTHTLEVSQIARTIARALRLNEDLTEAIALGHDLGHAPFGHDGEYLLNQFSPDGFEHNRQSVRVAEYLEKDGAGLNLSAEVLDGMLNHPLSCSPATLEGGVVRLADKIAYINHDIDDAIRAGILRAEELPQDVTAALGADTVGRIDFLVRDTITASTEKNTVQMTPEVYAAMRRLYDFMFAEVYEGEMKNRQFEMISPVITRLYEYYRTHRDTLPAEFRRADDPPERGVCDYIACMTDRFAIRTYEEIKQ